MPKVCKQLVPVAQKKAKQQDTLLILLSYLTTVAESLMDCDTCYKAKKMKCTVIIVIKVLHKMIPHIFLQLILDGCDRLSGVNNR